MSKCVWWKVGSSVKKDIRERGRGVCVRGRLLQASSFKVILNRDLNEMREKAMCMSFLQLL